MIRHLITAVLLFPILPAPLLWGDGISDSRGRSTAVALNYCRASFHRIRRNPSRRILIEEREKILNNLNLNGIADEEVIRLYSSVLDEIRQVRIADKDRQILKQKYKQEMRRQLGANAFLFGTQMATAQFGAAVRTGVNSWWDVRDVSWHRDVDVWRIDKQRMGTVVDKSTHFLDTFWKLAQKKNIPDRWLVRANDLNKLQAALQEQDAVVRLRVLKRMEGFMECYPPYWYYVARTQQSLGQLFAAAKTYDKLADLAAGHFRKDHMLAAGLANQAGIQEFLRQPEAVETAKEALKYSTDVWQANLMCAQVLVRNKRIEKAEDAILRNLDVDLEREHSLAALLSLYCHSDNEKKLIAMLSQASVLREIPIRALFECAKKLGSQKLPNAAREHFADSLFAYPSIHFGRDDFVVVAGSNWQIQQARISVQFGDRQVHQPQLEFARGNLRVRFRGVLELGNPLKPAAGLSEATLTLQYPRTSPIRLFLTHRTPTGHRSKEFGAATVHAPAPRTAAIARKHAALRITAIEFGDSHISLHPDNNAALKQSSSSQRLTSQENRSSTNSTNAESTKASDLPPAPKTP